MPKHEPTKIVGYLRTSTDDQLLGIDAQESASADRRRQRCDIAMVFVEHESGGDPERLELDKAIRHARRLKAYLVVAKLDRLARDQHFFMRLVDGNVPIIFGDLADVDFTTPEGRMISRSLAPSPSSSGPDRDRTREAPQDPQGPRRQARDARQPDRRCQGEGPAPPAGAGPPRRSPIRATSPPSPWSCGRRPLAPGHRPASQRRRLSYPRREGI